MYSQFMMHGQKNIKLRHTYMTPAGFEHAVPTREGPQTHALDRTAFVIGEYVTVHDSLRE